MIVRWRKKREGRSETEFPPCVCGNKISGNWGRMRTTHRSWWMRTTHRAGRVVLFMCRSAPVVSRSACMHIFLHVLPPLDRASSLLLCGLQTPQCAVTRLATTDAATAGENTASVSFPTLSGRKPDVYSRYYCVVVVVVFIDVATYLHPLLRLISMLWCTEHSVYTLCTL